MSHYQPYPNYKDSGIDWLGKIPEAWQVTRLKYVSELNPKKSSMKIEREELCTFLPMEKLKTDSVVLDETRVIEEVYDGYSYFGNGDILIAKVTPCFENKNIAIADDLVNGVGFGSTEINTIRSNEKSHNRFLYYRLQEEQFRKIAINAMTGTGGLKRVPSEIFQTFKIAIPSYDDQKLIAEQIDKETTRIDSLIAKKTRFIELLKEKQQAFITHAVTKGLNPDVPMKDSGIEWIGEVPEHWELKPLKISVTHNDDVIPDSTDPEELINYVDISSVSYSEGISNVEEMTFGNAPSRARRKAKAGDVIVSTVRTYLKAVASVDEKFADCTFSTGFAVLRPRLNKLEPRFLKWLVLNDLFIQAIEAHSEGLSYPAINPPTLVALKTAIPSIDEQKKISTILDLETSRIDTLIAKTQHSIELLKERRSAFITAAVTGQIDLREAS